MCWVGKTKKEKERHIAKEDIEVFKIMRLVKFSPEFLASPYQGHIYTVGKTETAYFDGDAKSMDKDIYIENGKYKTKLLISQGLHSYNASKVGLKICKGTRIFNEVFVVVPFEEKTGGSELGEYPISTKYGRYVKANCIIPKGTTYYENKHGEIVSESLKIVNYELINGYEEKYQEEERISNYVTTRTEA